MRKGSVFDCPPAQRIDGARTGVGGTTPATPADGEVVLAFTPHRPRLGGGRVPGTDAGGTRAASQRSRVAGNWRFALAEAVWTKWSEEAVNMEEKSWSKHLAVSGCRCIDSVVFASRPGRAAGVRRLARIFGRLRGHTSRDQSTSSAIWTRLSGTKRNRHQGAVYRDDYSGVMNALTPADPSVLQAGFVLPDAYDSKVSRALAAMGPMMGYVAVIVVKTESVKTIKPRGGRCADRSSVRIRLSDPDRGVSRHGKPLDDTSRAPLRAVIRKGAGRAQGNL